MTTISRVAFQPAPQWTHKDLLLVAILMLIGLLLRLPGLNEGLWYDEITTLLRFVRLPVEEIIENYQSRNNHILYSLLAHYSIALFGESAWSLRLPAVLFGVATIPATYYLGRQLASRNEAFLASALLTVSYHHVWFSQNARGYSGLLLGSVLLSIYFIRLLMMKNPGYRTVFAYAAIAALASWIHLTAALMMIAHGIIWLVAISPLTGKENTVSKVPATLGLLLAGLFSLAIYAPLLTRLPEEFSAGIANPELITFWYTSEWVLTEFWNAALKAIPGGGFIIFVGILAMIAGIWAYLKQGILPTAILILPILVTLILVSRYGEVFFPRFLFGSLVFFILIAVRGGYVLSRKVLPILSTRQVTAIGLIIVLATATRVPSAWKPKQDFVAAAEFVNAHRVQGDAVVCSGYTFRPLYEYLGMDCQRTDSLNELLELEKTHPRTWFLYTFPTPFQTYFPDVWRRVKNGYTPVTKIKSTVGGGDIVVLLKSTQAPE